MIIKKPLLFWLCIFIFIKIHSQNNFKVYDSIAKNHSLKVNDIFVDSLLNLSINESLITQKISHKYSIILYKKGNFVKAIKYAKIEVESFNNSKIINKKYTNSLYNLGRFYYNNLQFDKAIKNYKKVVELNNYPKRVGQAYGELGRCYKRKNELYKSVIYFKKGISILENLKEYKSLFSQYINLAITYDNINDVKSLNNSFYYLNKTKELSKKNISLKLSNIYSMNSGFANYYNTDLKYNFIKSKEYYLKNLKVSLKEKDTNVIVSSYLNLGELYIREKKDSAIYFLKKSLIFSSKLNRKIADSYRNISIFYLENNDKELALNFIDKSINNLYEEKLDLNTVKYKKLFLSSLKQKIEILIHKYENSNRIENLVDANKTVKKASRLIDIIQNDNLTENKSKLFWRVEASEVYLNGVYISYLLKNPESVFSFMEKNKALLLTKSIAKNTQQNNLPKNIAEKNNDLKKNILNLENKIFKTEGKEKQDILQDSLFNVKQVYEKYIDSIKIVYPRYFKNKLNIEQIKLSEVQKNLNKNEIVISYIWNKLNGTKELAFGLVIKNNKSKIFKIDSIDVLRTNIKTYKKLISKPFETKRQKKEFQKVSHVLYKQLFPDKETRNLLINKNVTILPDGDLQSIPFEALIKSENTFDYLLHSNNISYDYSMSFLKYNHKLNRKTSNNYVGYSPVSFQNLKLENLNNSEKEVIAIQEEIGGTILLNDDAKKNHFLKESNTSKVIHLATHADATKKPWIAFSDKKLELHELYTYKNNADLVVLSACNTSLGEIVVGEGVLSLARGFFYSGAKSVVSSLWNVNDKSTSFIMTGFYKNLKSGETKVQALTNAKRAYLNKHFLSEKSPYYWSSFVLIGDTGPIDLSSNNFIFITILFILIIGLFYLKKKK